MKPDFTSHIIFCLSTGNQPVNLVPVLQFGVRRVKLFSTEYTDGRRLTVRLKTVLEKRGIQVDEPVHISPEEEKDIATLVTKLIAEAHPHPSVVWNISGGQKIPAIALHTAFHNRTLAGFDDDQILYLEAKPPETWWFGSDRQMHHLPSSSDVSLDEILYLNDSVSDSSTCIYPVIAPEDKRLLQLADKAYRYYLADDLFREAFFSCMKPGFTSPASKPELTDILKKSLNAVKAELGFISFDIKDYSDFIGRIQKLSTAAGKGNKDDIERACKAVRILHKPEELYKSYWNDIRKRTLEHSLAELDSDRVRLHDKPLSEQEYLCLKQQLENIGGVVKSSTPVPVLYRDEVTFSGIGKNSALFEWMVAAAVMHALDSDPALKESVAEIHLQCMTRSASRPAAKHDAELDLVITTRFGTLIILEVKTYDFSGDTAKGKDHSAYKKSGPYGKAVMVGPLIGSIISKDSAGNDLYPHYIDGKIQAQKATAEQNGISYCFLDGIKGLLTKELSIHG